jgi:hypothetical protein
MLKPVFQKNIFILSILLFFSILTRALYGGSPLNGDEAITFNHYAFNSWKDLVFNYTDTNQHTLFSLLSNVCLQVFGENEWSFRLPSILSGILAVPLTYLVGLKFLNSRFTSFIAALLILLSKPHLIYSQAGRGYALTVLLSLLFIWSIGKLIESQNNLVDAPLFFISGIGLVMTLPSNAVFLAGSAIFSVFLILDRKENSPPPVSILFKKLTFYYLVLLFAVTYYLYGIQEGLQTGVQNYSVQSIGSSSLLEIIDRLMTPFGYWIYPFFFLGVFFFTNRKLLFAFLSLLVVPTIILFLIGAAIFSRIYIFLLPFIFFVSAVGIDSLFNKLLCTRPNLKAIVALVLLGLLFTPVVNFWIQYYPSRTNVKEATLYEAQLISDTIKDNTSKNVLVVSLLGNKEKSVLIHYLEKKISGDMFRFLSGEKPEKIFLIAHKDSPPDEFPLGGYLQDKFLTFPKKSFRKLECKENICLYEWNIKLNRFIPPTADLDYETQITFPTIPQIEFQSKANSKLLGKQSLLINKMTKQKMNLSSTEIKSVQSKNDGYLLLSYLKPFGQRSNLILWDITKKEWPNQVALLNPYMGRVGSRDKQTLWQMTYILYPIKKGKHNLTEIFYLDEQLNVFDGIQSFFITLR